MPPLGIAPRLSAPQAEVLLLYYSGRARGGAGHRSRISTLRRLYATIYNTPPCVRRDSNPNLMLGRHKYYPCTTDALLHARHSLGGHEKNYAQNSTCTIAYPRPNGATAARWIPDPKAGGSNPSSVTHPGVAQLVEQWTVKRAAQRSIGRQFKSASPE